jgi:DNA-binding transcriptional ArsR family regulator
MLKKDKTMENLGEDGTFIIKDLETLRVIADPLRAQILELLVHRPQTVKYVAEKLGLAPGKLYYHFSLLEKHGLIEVIETRMVSNMVEKLYRSVAAKMDVDPALLQFATSSGKDNIHTLLTSILDATREDLIRSMDARAAALERGADPEPREIVINRLTARLTKDQYQEFKSQVFELLHKFDQSNLDSPEAENLPTYSLMVALYPSYFFDEEKGE